MKLFTVMVAQRAVGWLDPPRGTLISSIDLRSELLDLPDLDVLVDRPNEGGVDDAAPIFLVAVPPLGLVRADRDVANSELEQAIASLAARQTAGRIWGLRAAALT